MKRTVIILTGLATLAATAYVGSQLRAQNQPQSAGRVQQAVATAAAAPLRTRIAVINLQSVIKQYAKWGTFEQTYKDLYGRYNNEFERKKATGVNLKTQLDQAKDDQAREKIQQQLRALDRDVQDLGEDAKKQLGKLRDEQAVQIYREVEQAVLAYARSYDIEMVLHYSDAVAQADLYQPANVERKIQTLACMPMYMAPGMDITNAVATMLNQRLGATGAPAPGGAR